MTVYFAVEVVVSVVVVPPPPPPLQPAMRDRDKEVISNKKTFEAGLLSFITNSSSYIDCSLITLS